MAGEIQTRLVPNRMERPNRTQALLTKLLQERAREWSGVAEKSRPLQLLDLPLDILEAIIKEVTHTNDLTSLALTHSVLHGLTVPHIYSRFDIVWPEANPTVESRVGVDALTYGLATLVMAHDVFGEAPYQQTCSKCDHCQDHKPRLQSSNLPVRIRRGNYFAQYTRKFSLGNGPADWVTEYLITKEGGKMLGTLVALALGRMRNLEAFIWDMPTGVLRDVWLALASLGNRNDGRECRLEKVWVRWHDNKDAAPISPPPPHGTTMHQTNLPSLLHGTATSLFQIPPYPSVEFPTFSILPPLKSISVLDIDEVPYAEELSILLERSLDKLQELRVGVAVHAQRDLPFRPIEDRSAIPPPFPIANEFSRPGGILGILVSRLLPDFSMAPSPSGPLLSASTNTPVPVPQPELVEDTRPGLPTKDAEGHDELQPVDINQLGVLLSAQSLQDDAADAEMTHSGYPAMPATTPRKEPDQTPYGFDKSVKGHHGKLRLATLELERIYLSIPVLSRAIDWSRLESLTLLGCMNHEQLWKALRRTFTPPSLRNRTPTSKLGSALRQRSSSTSYNTANASEYKLNIKRIHTDTVTKALLSFIKDTLSPDTLEWLFLQETLSYKSTVTVDEIYKAIRRHKTSLRKLLIDSELRIPMHHERDRERDPIDTNWRRWTCHQDLITLITSGKMQLRELSICIDYRHWHYFLQRLPSATGLRSLHISHIVDHPYGRSFDPKEVALQVLDIISLRPTIELCYLGVEKKCFEILEYKSNYVRRASPVNQSHNDLTNTFGITTHTHAHLDDEDDEDQDDGGTAHHMNLNMNMNQFGNLDASEDGDNWDVNSNATSNVDETDNDDDDQDDERDPQNKKPVFRLREILFYDDKISIFKARHGKL
ncbi:hypothetical protein H2198_005506 [Neophaeococcomyces mojaviensis]|uniref:Uncharacterized protein n=1 Tax=Neophaeococcomyces mojaviensis TaxID=3383035 RepID=A0ACC3A5I0_9EURO|nr:hypothetical protein H2198_005506 [Knufia sp. JES_112]